MLALIPSEATYLCGSTAKKWKKTHLYYNNGCTNKPGFIYRTDWSTAKRENRFSE